jgi:hypothetical protein
LAYSVGYTAPHGKTHLDFISIEQVKEKFGGLRFYYVTQMIPELHPSLYQEGKRVGWRYKQSYDAGKIVGGKYADSVTIYDADRSMRRAADHFDGAVSLAESLSVRMCEECGNKAEVRPGKTSTWLKCYCDNCLNKGN